MTAVEAPNAESTLGGRIREARRASALRQVDLAERADLPRSVINDLEADRPRDLGVRKFYRLAAALGVTIEWLLDLPDLCERTREADWFDQIDWQALQWVPLADAARIFLFQPADVRMLASISFHGQQPTTADQWALLHSVIRLAIQHADAWVWLRPERRDGHG